MLHYEQVEYSNAGPEGLVLELFFTVTKDANSSNSDKKMKLICNIFVLCYEGFFFFLRPTDSIDG